MSSPENIIKRPLLTEKSTVLRETGGQAEVSDPEAIAPQVAFEVAKTANKVEIRQAVEKLFNVKVLKVRTSIARGKDKRVGRFTGRQSNWKKAFVTLAPGQTIEFFEGV